MIPLSIKKNQAFEFLCQSVQRTSKDVEKSILSNIKKEFPKFGDYEDINCSIEYFFTELGYTIEETVEVVFPNDRKNREVMQILDSIIFWGDAQYPCELCGCAMEVETETEGKRTYSNHKCSNPYCDNSNTNCPDFDAMKGGKDYHA